LLGVVVDLEAIAEDQDADLLRFLAAMPATVSSELRSLYHVSRLILGLLRGELGDVDNWRHAASLLVMLLGAP
jgi:hypothetical protein